MKCQASRHEKIFFVSLKKVVATSIDARCRIHHLTDMLRFETEW